MESNGWTMIYVTHYQLRDTLCPSFLDVTFVDTLVPVPSILGCSFPWQISTVGLRAGGVFGVSCPPWGP